MEGNFNLRAAPLYCHSSMTQRKAKRRRPFKLSPPYSFGIFLFMSKLLRWTSFLYHISGPDEGGGFCSQLNVIFQIKKSVWRSLKRVSCRRHRNWESRAVHRFCSSVGGTGVHWITMYGFCPLYWFCVPECVCVCVCACLWMCLCAVENWWCW